MDWHIQARMWGVVVFGVSQVTDGQNLVETGIVPARIVSDLIESQHLEIVRGLEVAVELTPPYSGHAS